MQARVTIARDGLVTSVEIDGVEAPALRDQQYVMVQAPTQLEPGVEVTDRALVFSERFERNHYIRVGDLYVDELTVVDHESTVRFTRTDETILIDVLHSEDDS